MIYLSPEEVNTMATTADRISEAMKLRDMRQADLVEKTGISKGALSSYISGRYVPKQNNVYLIAKALDVSEAWLMGADVPMQRIESPTLTRRDTRDIEKILEQTGEQLTSQEDLMLDGDPASPEAIESILSAMQIGMELAKKINKEKYTPKKYKKD